MPINFEGANVDLTKPSDMTDEECFGLPAQQGVDINGFPYFVTAWIPNYDDLKALNEGRPLFLKVLGNSHQPVSLFTVDENGEGNF